MKKEISASVTVYLCLVLGIMLSFTFTVLEAARQQVIKAEIEGVMDIGLFSVLGEYHKQLLERYDIFAIDAGYGNKSSKTKQLEAHLQFYLNKNLKKEGSLFYSQGADLTKLSCDGVSMKEYLLLSDNSGQVMREAILNYMKHKKGSLITNILDRNYESLENQENSGSEGRSQWREKSSEIKSLIEERNRERKEDEESIVLDNPADYVETTIEEGILGLALPSGKEISAQSITKSNYFSYRDNREGEGNLAFKSSSLNGITKKTYLEEYYFAKCSYFNQEREDSLLKYQLEYLLQGEEKDQDNLEKTLQRILLIREGINLSYLMTDSQKQAEAETMALLISVACLMPELKEPLKTVILFAWSYAESVKDIRILLDGKQVAATKSDSTWNTPLSQLLSFTSHLGEYKCVENGMAYQDYLKFFLWTTNEQKLLSRFMDICEMDIRTITQNPYFSLDQCITVFHASSYFISGYGGDYEITRTGYYE